MKTGKFKAAQTELLRALTALSADQAFYVILFDHRTVCMFNEKNYPVPRPFPADESTVLRLAGWLAQVKFGHDTDPQEALELALAMQPDAVYLLTDGELDSPGRIVRFLRRENQDARQAVKEGKKTEFPSIPIHTIGFHDRSGEQTLKHLSELSGGTYRYVTSSNTVSSDDLAGRKQKLLEFTGANE